MQAVHIVCLKRRMHLIIVRRLARAYFDKVGDNFTDPNSQLLLREIVANMESNIQNEPGSGHNIRIWFNAMRHIVIKDDRVSESLEETLFKLNSWIEDGRAPIEAYFYRYIAKFLILYENDQLGTDVARRDLSLYLEDMHRHSFGLEARTITQEWLGKHGRGLCRLIKNTEFRKLQSKDAVEKLAILNGRLPQRDGFASERTSYVKLQGNEVYFRPISISNRIGITDANKIVEFGLGFSYDGLRSYYDSINIVTVTIDSTKYDMKPGEHYRITITGHNYSMLYGILVNSGNMIGVMQWNDPRNAYESNSYYAGFDPDKWPENGQSLEVRLQKETTMNGRPAWIVTANIYTQELRMPYN